jgi:hypothetical protein
MILGNRAQGDGRGEQDRETRFRKRNNREPMPDLFLDMGMEEPLGSWLFCLSIPKADVSGGGHRNVDMETFVLSARENVRLDLDPIHTLYV